MQFSRLILLAAITLGFIASQNSLASDAEEWTFEATPYLMGAGLDGEVGLRGVTADVDMSFSDIWDTLDSAFMGVLTAQKGPWTFGIDAVYFKVSDEETKSVTGPFGRVSINGALEVETAITIYQANAAYRLLDDKTQLDLVGGLRYTKLKADADVVIAGSGILFPGGALSADGSESWTDVVVGVRALHPVSENVDLLGYFDVGAGGSDLSYQILAGVNWEFKEDYTAKIGYRVMDWDYDDNGTIWDMQTSGPYLGLGIRF